MTAAQDSRAQFEAWARSYGTWEVVRDDDPQLGTTGYTDLTLTIAWHAVQASRAALDAAKDCQLPECIPHGCFGHCMKAGEKRDAMVTDQQILDVLSTTEPRTAVEIAALIGLSPRFQLSHIRSRLLTLRDDSAVRKVDGGKPPRWLKTEALP